MDWFDWVQGWAAWWFEIWQVLDTACHCHTHPPPTLLLLVANPISADKEIHSEENRLAGKVCIKSENVWERRNWSDPRGRYGKRGEERIPVRSRTPEVWKGGALFALHSILQFCCTSICYTIIFISFPKNLLSSHGRMERRRSLDVNSKCASDLILVSELSFQKLAKLDLWFERAHLKVLGTCFLSSSKQILLRRHVFDEN